MITIKSPREIELLKQAGNVVYQTHQYIKPFIKEGITTKELDRLCEEFIRSKGCTPSFKGCEGFPASVCTSVNDCIVHGVPSNYKLKNGDIITIDIGACYKGYHGDSGWTYAVGNISDNDKYLMEHTEKALYEGIKKAEITGKGRLNNQISSLIFMKLHENGAANHEDSAPRNNQNQPRQEYRSGGSKYGKGKSQSPDDATASPKQIKYLLDLARNNDVTPQGPLSWWELAVYACDFIREDGEWKVWHMQNLTDVHALNGRSWGVKDPEPFPDLPEFHIPSNLCIRMYLNASCLQDRFQVFIKPLLRKSVLGNSIAEHTARFFMFLKDIHPMSHQGEVVSRTHPGRTAANDRNPSACPHVGLWDCDHICLSLVYRIFLQPPYVDGRIDHGAAAFPFAWMFTHKGTGCRERIPVSDDPDCSRIILCPDHGDIAGNIHMRGAQSHTGDCLRRIPDTPSGPDMALIFIGKFRQRFQDQVCRHRTNRTIGRSGDHEAFLLHLLQNLHTGMAISRILHITI